jgi:hypothetical protein
MGGTRERWQRTLWRAYEIPDVVSDEVGTRTWGWVVGPEALSPQPEPSCCRDVVSFRPVGSTPAARTTPSASWR